MPFRLRLLLRTANFSTSVSKHTELALILSCKLVILKRIHKTTDVFFIQVNDEKIYSQYSRFNNFEMINEFMLFPNHFYFFAQIIHTIPTNFAQC